jgi:hypothetical protein
VNRLHADAVAMYFELARLATDATGKRARDDHR